jgi:hypothetical protein
MTGSVKILRYLILAWVIGLSPACKENNQPKETIPPMHQKDIKTVMDDHVDELMALPGVVGVYIGVLEDEETPCIKVMVVEKTSELEEKIPETLESFPVVIEESGVIRPM